MASVRESLPAVLAETKEQKSEGDYLLKSMEDSISYEVFKDPVVTYDGQTYSEAPLFTHWDHQEVHFEALIAADDSKAAEAYPLYSSPLTNRKLPTTRVVPNFAVKDIITEFKRDTIPKLQRLEEVESRFAEQMHQLQSLRVEVSRLVSVNTRLRGERNHVRADNTRLRDERDRLLREREHLLNERSYMRSVSARLYNVPAEAHAPLTYLPSEEIKPLLLARMPSHLYPTLLRSAKHQPSATLALPVRSDSRSGVSTTHAALFGKTSKPVSGRFCEACNKLSRLPFGKGLFDEVKSSRGLASSGSAAAVHSHVRGQSVALSPNSTGSSVRMRVRRV